MSSILTYTTHLSGILRYDIVEENHKTPYLNIYISHYIWT